MSDIKQAQQHLYEADAIMISAGAGMGVDSGLPDFRGVEGFWKAYPIIKERGLRFEEMANPRWFQEDPTLAWAFYGHRLNLYRTTTPHEGFKQLKSLVDQKEDYFIFTSNVDGQFQKAGFDTKKIVEIHGSIHHFQCTDNCTQQIWEADDKKIEIDIQSFRAQMPLPRCPHCHNVCRPNILMFQDSSFNSQRTDIQSQRLQRFLDYILQEKKRLVILEFGAGEAVPTVRIFSEHVAQLPLCTLIRINPRDTKIPNGAISLAMSAKEAIEKLLS